jgi:hypothetical protein
MENTTKNLEFIDNLIANQRKARMWTAISVFVFVVMAIIVLFYSKQLAEAKVKLTKSELELQKAYDSLKLRNALVDSLNGILAKRSDSVEIVNTGLALNLDKNRAEADSVKNLKDTLTVLLNTTLQQYVYNNDVATEKINELYQQSFPGSAKKASNTITEQIIKTNVIREEKFTTPAIAVRYMKKYKELAFEIVQKMEERNTKIETPQQVAGVSFNPTVKYFNSKDKSIAESIAKKLNDLYKGDISQPFEIQQVDINMPPRHFEIWIGQYIKKDYSILKLQEMKKINQ